MQARGEVAEQIVISPPAKEPAKGDKLQVLEEVAAELRSGRPRIFMNELIKFAARRLEMSESGLRTYVYRTTAKAQRDKWLFGENPKITRAKMKFDELLRLRETMRDKGGPKPYKRQFAKMAAEHLGMKQSSAEVYIYEKLTKEQAKLLDFGTAGNTPRFTSVEKIEILKEERKRFTEENGYRPLKSELAKFSADKLGLKVSSARTFINYLDESVVRELDFANSKLVIFERKNSEDVRAVLLGAVAILRFNGEKVTISGLSQVLNCSRLAIETYAQKHPDVWAIIER